jgi:hypothetical protein
MNELKIINQHMIIRETVGYDAIKDINLCDTHAVIAFLEIVWNYEKMKEL